MQGAVVTGGATDERLLPVGTVRSIREALRSGLALSWENRRVWAFVWAFHLLGAALSARILSSVWQETLGGRLAEGALGGADTLGILVDLGANHGAAIARLMQPLSLLLLLYLWLGSILAAGILGSLDRSARGGRSGHEGTSLWRSRGQVPMLPGFLGDCGAYLGRFSRLLLVQVAATSLVLFLLGRLLSTVTGWYFGPTPDPVAAFRAALLPLPVLGLALLICLLAGDFAKVRIVRDGRRSALLAWLAGAGWVLARLPRTLGLQLFLLLLGALLAGGYLFIASHLAVPGVIGTLMLLLLQQLALLLRSGLRVLRFGAELAMYRAVA